MSIRALPLSALAILTLTTTGLLGCSGTADTGTEDLSSNANAGYFAVTRVDMRKCMAPLCGGYFVARVNDTTTRCGDGTYHAECYVSEIDTSALALADSDDQKLRDGLAQGQALVRGTLKKQTFNGSVIGRLVAVEGWAGVTTSKPTGTFYRAKDVDIKCVKAPCPTAQAAELNSKSVQNVEGVAFDKTAIAANGKQIALANSNLDETDGVLVAGDVVTQQTKLGTEKTLVASEFYFRMTSAEGKTCGGFAALTCPTGYFCSYSTAAQCGAGDMSGKCATQPQVCPMVYMPVCGCDGHTYSNSCVANRSGSSVAASGPCK